MLPGTFQKQTMPQKKSTCMPGVVAHTCNPSTRETEQEEQ
jgi:hypothetical protein